MCGLAASLLTTACGQPAAQHPYPVIVVVPTANAPAPGLGQPLTALLVRYAAAAVDVGRAQIVLIVGSAAPVNVDLTPMRGARLEQSHPAQTAASNVEALARRIAGARTAQAGLDELGPLQKAARNAAPGAPIYVIGSGVSTADPVDLRVIGWGVDPREVAADLRHKGEEPDLTGHSVTFIGLADTRAPQPDLPNPIRDRVAALWIAICASSHASACQIQVGDLPDKAPATAVPTPIVAVPSYPSLVPRLQPSRCATDVVLTSDQVPFPPESAAVTLTARDAIARIAKQLVSPACGVRANRRLAIRGHVAQIPGPTSTEAGAQALSRSRAQAVCDELIRHGVPKAAIASVTGAGDRENLVPDVRSDGSVDPVAAARNRRVEIRLI